MTVDRVEPRATRHSSNGTVGVWLWGDMRSKLATIVIAFAIVAAVLAPLVARYPYAQQEVRNAFASPSWSHWLGTDDLGRDVWSRMIYGLRVSLTASLLAVSVGLILGVPAGLIAGFKGGWLDTVIMRVADTLLSFPGIVLAIGITAALGPGLTNAMIAVGVVFSPGIARIMRSQVLTTRGRSYVEVALTFGSPSWRTALRHIIPNSIQPVIIQASFLLGVALLAEASLSFLGLGARPPEPSLGAMLRRGAQFIARQPGGVYPPGVAIAILVLAFNALGDSLRDALDPVGRSRRLSRAARRRGSGR